MVTKRMSNNWQAVFSLVLLEGGRPARLERARDADGDRRAARRGTLRPRSGRAERLREHRRPAHRRSAGRGQGADRVSPAVGRDGVRQPAAPDRTRLCAAGARQRPRLPDGAADQRGAAHRRSARRRHEPDRPARAEGVHAVVGRRSIAVFLDALNATNSDSYEGVGSVLGTSTAFGVPHAVHPAAPHPARLQSSAGKGDTHHENHPHLSRMRPGALVFPHPRSPEVSARAPSRPPRTARRLSRWRRCRRARRSSTRGAAVFAAGMATALYGFMRAGNGEYTQFGEATSRNKQLGAAGIAAAFTGGTMMFLGSRGIAIPAVERHRQPQNGASPSERWCRGETRARARSRVSPPRRPSRSRRPRRPRRRHLTKAFPSRARSSSPACGGCHRPDARSRMTRISYPPLDAGELGERPSSG